MQKESDFTFNSEEHYWNKTRPFEVLVGQTLVSIENRSDEIIFETDDGKKYRQVYYEDCCASCTIEEIHGDLEDLVGSPILMAEEVSNRQPTADVLEARKAEYEKEKSESGNYFYYDSLENYLESRYESETWTFYKIATIKGSVTIRWYGYSNGYYSESSTFERIE